MKKNRYPALFKHYYDPIKDSLPLYKEISSKNVSILFSGMGFTDTTISPLLEVQKFQRSRSSFTQKLLNDTPIFLIQAQKERE
jgi:hypothetical protein